MTSAPRSWWKWKEEGRIELQVGDKNHQDLLIDFDGRQRVKAVWVGSGKEGIKSLATQNGGIIY